MLHSGRRPCRRAPGQPGAACAASCRGAARRPDLAGWRTRPARQQNARGMQRKVPSLSSLLSRKDAAPRDDGKRRDGSVAVDAAAGPTADAAMHSAAAEGYGATGGVDGDAGAHRDSAGSMRLDVDAQVAGNLWKRGARSCLPEPVSSPRCARKAQRRLVSCRAACGGSGLPRLHQAYACLWHVVLVVASRA